MKPSAFHLHFKGGDGLKPAPVPEAVAAPGGPAANARGRAGRGRVGVTGRVREPVPVQPGEYRRVFGAPAEAGRGRAFGRRPACERCWRLTVPRACRIEKVNNM